MSVEKHVCMNNIVALNFESQLHIDKVYTSLLSQTQFPLVNDLDRASG